MKYDMQNGMDEEVRERILQTLEAHPRGMTLLELSADLEISRNTMAKYMELLSSHGNVELRRVGPAKVWTISHALSLEHIWEHSSTTAIALLDAHSRVWKANEAFEEFVGAKLPPGTPLAKHLWFWKYALNDGPSLAGRCRHALEGRDMILSEQRVPERDDGGTLLLDIQVRTTLIEGARGVVLLIEDLTPLDQMRTDIARRAREALRYEQRMNEVLNALPNGVIIVGETDRVVQANPPARELLGALHPGDVLPELFPAAQRAAWQSAREQVCTRHDPVTLMLELGVPAREIELTLTAHGSEGAPDELLVTLHEREATTRLRNELNLCRARSRSLTDNSSLAVWFMDHERRYTWLNRRALDLLGRSEAEMLGRTNEELFPPEVAEKMHLHSHPVWKRGDDNTFTFSLDTTQGPAWFRMTLTPIKGPQGGEVMGLSGTAMDITEEVQAHQTLRDAEARCRALIETVEAAIWITDTDGRFESVNRQALELLERPGDEVIGRTNDELFPPELAVAFNRSDQRVITRNMTVETTYPVDLPSGRRWFYTRKGPVVNDREEIVGLCGVSHDITEVRRAQEAQRDSETRYRQIFESTSDALWTKDREGRFTSINPQALTRSGMVEDDIIGRTAAEVWPGENGTRLHEATMAVLQSGRPQSYESNIDTPRGRFHVSTKLYPLRDGDGNLNCVTGVTRELTGPD